MATTTATIHKVEPTNVDPNATKMIVELARKGSKQSESVKCWITFPALPAATTVELEPQAAHEILRDWFDTQVSSMLRDQTRECYAAQKGTFDLDLSVAAVFAAWKESAGSGRLDADAISAWFKTSQAAATLIQKFVAAGLPDKQVESLTAKVLASFVSCAAPVPNVTVLEAEKLLPYLSGDTSVSASFLVRKLNAVVAKSRKTDLADLI